MKTVDITVVDVREYMRGGEYWGAEKMLEFIIKGDKESHPAIKKYFNSAKSVRVEFDKNRGLMVKMPYDAEHQEVMISGAKFLKSLGYDGDERFEFLNKK